MNAAIGLSGTIGHGSSENWFSEVRALPSTCLMDKSGQVPGESPLPKFIEPTIHVGERRMAWVCFLGFVLGPAPAYDERIE